jgi:hypothetical protein
MGSLDNSLAFLVVSVGWFIVAFAQTILKGGRLRLSWANNSVELSMTIDRMGGQS